MLENTTLNLDSLITLSSQQISSDLAGEVVIMDLQKGVYHGVQGVSAFIWNLLAHPKSIREICDRVIAEYDVEASRCQSDVMALIQQLLNEGLVQFVHPSPAKVSLA